MKKILFLIVISLITFTGCTNDNLTKVTLMLDYTPNTNHTGIYVADKLGYFQEEGIDLEIIDTGSNGVEQAVSTGSVDFGISYQENLTMSNDKGLKNLKSIYAILNENTSGLISSKDKNILKPSDLKGKTYCGWGSDVESAIVKYVAKIGYVEDKDIKIVNGGTDFLRSTDDNCDYFWEFKGWSGIEANLEKKEFNWISLKDLGLDWYTPIIITSDEFIKDNKEIVQSFVNAIIKGYTYAANNPKEASDIFLKYNKSYDKEFIKASQKYLSRYYLSDSSIAGYQKENMYKDFTKFLKDNKIIKDVDYKNLYTNEFIDNYYQS